MRKITTAALLTIVLFVLLLSKVKAQDTASPEADAIREKVQEKLKQAQNKPKAYLGTVTDKTDVGMQIESVNGEINQVSIDNENTTFAKINEKTEEITFDDIGIGDFIVAMGYSEENGLLDSLRILLTTPPEEIQRKIIIGEVTSVNKNTIDLKTAENDVTLTFPRRWKGPEIDEVSKGDTLISVGEGNSREIEIRTIHLASPQE
jgi:hypothetical protein